MTRARAATAGELVKLRSDGQWSKLRLCFVVPPVVFKARVNGTFASLDQVNLIPFDGVTVGAYSDLVAGMTLRIGTTEGASDIGVARVRSATASMITIGRTSDLSWANDLYLTVVDEFALWAKQPTLLGVMMDDDVEYVDQHGDGTLAPVPVLGPDRAVLLSAATIDVDFDGSASYCLDGETITGYAWSATGSSASSGTTTATPTFTFATAGYKRITCTVTASSGKTAVGHRVLWVYDTSTYAPADQFEIETLAGDTGEGGWTLSVRMYASAAQTDVQDRCKVILIADDYYAGVLGSVGQVADCESNVLVGWIAGESIEYDRQTGTVRFEVKGPSWWADKISTEASFVENALTAPTTWQQMYSLTLDKALWHFLYWRSTMLETMDVFLSEKTTIMGGVVSSMGTLWTQVRDTALNRSLCRARADRYGRLYVEPDPQLMSAGDKNALPVIQDISRSDWSETITFGRQVTTPVGMLQVSGLAIDSGGVTTLVMSRAAGMAYKRFGRYETRDRIVAVDQAGNNAMTGALMAKLNNPYPSVQITLAQNNRMVDIGPNAWLTLTIEATDTPRAIAWTAKRLLINRVEYQINPENGAVSTVLDCEAEVIAENAITFYPPSSPVSNASPTSPTYPSFSYVPPTNPNPGEYVNPGIPPSASCPASAPANGPYPLWTQGVLSDTDPFGMYGDLRCVIRGTGADNPSKYQINGRFYTRPGVDIGDFTWVETLDEDYTVYGLDATNARVATGVKDAVASPGRVRTGTFAPAANVGISRVEVAMDAAYTLGYYSYAEQGTFDQTTKLATSKFIRFANGGVYAYLLYQLRGNAIPSGWYCQCDNVGFWIGYRNMVADKYFKLRRRIEYGQTSLSELYYGVGIDNPNATLKTTTAVTPVAGVSDITAYVLLGTAGGTTRNVQIRDSYRVTTPTPNVQFTYYTKYEVWLTPMESKKIIFDQAYLWNICPPAS